MSVTCDGLGWCVKRDAAPPGEPMCDGAGLCVKGYAAASGPTVPVSGPEDGVRACQCGHSLVNHWQTGKRVCMACPEGACADYRPPVVADTTAGEAWLYNEETEVLYGPDPDHPRLRYAFATEVDPGAGRALAAALNRAARSGGAQDDGLRERITALAEELGGQRSPGEPYGWRHRVADRLRRALAGPDDARQDGAE